MRSKKGSREKKSENGGGSSLNAIRNRKGMTLSNRTVERLGPDWDFEALKAPFNSG